MMMLPSGVSHWVPQEEPPELARWDLTTGGLLDRAAARGPNLPALIYSPRVHGYGVVWSFGELRDRAREVAGALVATGVGRGDRVAALISAVPEWFALQFGCAYAGAVLVPMNPLFQVPEVRHVLQQSRARLLVVQPEFRERDLTKIAARAIEEVQTPQRIELVVLGEAAPIVATAWESWLTRARSVSADAVARRADEIRSGDLAQIQFTSGTTGAPKGAMLRHGSTVNNARFFAERAELPERGRNVTGLPMFHCGGSVLSTLGSIAKCSALLPLAAFDAHAAIQTIQDEKADAFFAVPTMQLAIEEALAVSGGDISSLERVVTGGATVSTELIDRWHTRYGIATSVTYGLTEASPVISQTSLSDPMEMRRTSVGRPLPGAEVDIVDPLDDSRVPIGQQGEIRTRGWLVMEGYFGDTVATRNVLTPDGWLRTGDLGTIDERGYLRITGRAKDMVIRGGENIYPVEIELHIEAIPGVLQAAVVGVPDERYGEVCAAFIRADPAAGLDPDRIRTELEGRLARFKIPKYLKFVDQFPSTPSGKVQRFRLREQFAHEIVASDD